MAADLAFIQPQRVERQVEDLQLVITPLTIDMLPDVLGLLEPVLDQLGGLIVDGTVDRLVDGKAQPADLLRVTKLIARGGKSVIDATALLARCDRAWLGGQLLDRAAVIAVDVIKVNADFFRQAIQQVRNSPESLAALAGLMDRGQAATKVG